MCARWSWPQATGAKPMADGLLEERLQPSLLDRLTDDDPGSPAETRDERAIDSRRLRQILRRDLGWLLNSTNLWRMRLESDPHDQPLPCEIFPNVAASTLNFGVDEVAGLTSTSRRAALIEGALETAIRRFEPRILPGSLSITLSGVAKKQESLVTFDIRADMWAEPIPQDLYLRSEVDLTTGALRLEVAT